MRYGTGQRRKMIKHKYSYGIIVFYRFPRSIKYLLLKHKAGHWSFPKGHKESGESKMETAIRELWEESGIKKISFLNKNTLITENYKFKNTNGVLIYKKVGYFIAESKVKTVRIDNNEICNFKWCTFEKALSRVTFKQSGDLLKIVHRMITKKILSEE